MERNKPLGQFSITKHREIRKKTDTHFGETELIQATFKAEIQGCNWEFGPVLNQVAMSRIYFFFLTLEFSIHVNIIFKRNRYIGFQKVVQTYHFMCQVLTFYFQTVDCVSNRSIKDSFIQYVPKFFEKLTFLTPSYAHVRVHIRG